MTIKFKKYGKCLVTRHDAQRILACAPKSSIPALDFSGVDVANHCFADELGKMLMQSYDLSDLGGIIIKGANPYVSNCVAAGFITAAS